MLRILILSFILGSEKSSQLVKIVGLREVSAEKQELFAAGQSKSRAEFGGHCGLWEVS